MDKKLDLSILQNVQNVQNIQNNQNVQNIENIENKENNNNNKEFYFMNIISQLDNSSKSFLIVCEWNSKFIKEPILPNIFYNIFNAPPQMFPYPNSKQICFLNTLYITGGRINNSNTNQTFNLKYDFATKKITIKRFTSMCLNRELHTMVYVPKKNFLVACGGASLKSCEYYNFIENKWILLPDLNNLRANATCCLINDYIIYIIGGYNHEKQIFEKGYEYLDLNKDKKDMSWNYILMFEELSLCAMGAIVNNKKNELILLGGFNGKKTYLNTSKKLIIENGLISKIENQENVVITKGVIFFNSQEFTQRNNNIFINFDFRGGFHEYNIEENKWLYIPPENN